MIGEGTLTELDKDSVVAAYRRQAPFYDMVFGVLLHPGRIATVKMINQLCHGRVLEVGVGTGLSLPRYRRDLRITGIDISDDMLHRARERVREERLTNIEALPNMDAEALSFGADSFDVVAAMYVASVVPNPDQLMREMQRVCKPGGDIFIVNHFAAEGGLRGFTEDRLATLSKKLGWRPDFKQAPFMAHGSLEILKSRRVSPFGLFTILHCRNRKAADAAALGRSAAD